MVVGALQTGQRPSIGSVSPNTSASLNSWIFRPQDSDPHHEILKMPFLPFACSGISMLTICETWNARALSAMFSNILDIACASRPCISVRFTPVSYTHLRAHETPEHLVCRLLLEKKKTTKTEEQNRLKQKHQQKKKKKSKQLT